MSETKKELVLRLWHGRQRPDEELRDWGTPGPCLKIAYLHVTYLTTFRIGLLDGGEAWMDVWEENETDGIVVDDLFHYDGVFYGDWFVETVDEKDVTEEFDVKKAVFSKDRHWINIPKEEGRIYTSGN